MTYAILVTMPQTPAPMPNLIGASRASILLDRSVKTVHRYAEEGLLTPAGRISGARNGAVIFREDEVLALAEKLKAKAAS